MFSFYNDKVKILKAFTFSIALAGSEFIALVADLVFALTAVNEGQNVFDSRLGNI